MTVLEFSLLVCGCSLIAGLVGALTGLGGGVVLVPLLSLFFKVDIRYAIGASLVSVIATSSGAAAAYVKEGFSNIRIGMFLEIATTMGALIGASLAARVSTHAIAIVFGVVLLFSAYFSRKPRSLVERAAPPDPFAIRLRLNGTFLMWMGRELTTCSTSPPDGASCLAQALCWVFSFPTPPNSWRAAHPWCWPVTTTSCRQRRTSIRLDHWITTR
jgi:uncharacterized membrane protein YfcA